MDIFQDKVIIVTGASEGIGRALCLALAPQKPKLVLAARNQDRLAILSARGKLGRWVKLIAPGLIDKGALKAIREAK